MISDGEVRLGYPVLLAVTRKLKERQHYFVVGGHYRDHFCGNRGGHKDRRIVIQLGPRRWEIIWNANGELQPPCRSRSARRGARSLATSRGRSRLLRRRVGWQHGPAGTSYCS